MNRMLTPAEIAQALREAAVVSREPGHDLMTTLDVLAQDHRRDLRGPWAQLQLADAVATFADPTFDGHDPIETAEAWCRGNDADLETLLLRAAEALEESHGAPERIAA